MRDTDNERDNFPAFAYSPSCDYMYTSPAAGPDFSGLFSVARNVYQRQVSSRLAALQQSESKQEKYVLMLYMSHSACFVNTCSVTV